MAGFWDEIGDDLKGVVPIIQTVAPTIATALLGPAAGMAVQALSTALLGKPDGTAADVGAALATATPDQLLALRKEDNDFKARMRALDIDLARISAGDRDSARQREAKTGDSLTPRMLALTVTVGFFSVLGYVITKGVPAQGGEAVLILLGTLGGGWMTMLAYYFGSSSGQQEGAERLASLAQGARR
ncbi:hypothetical protein UFOVP78_52 [uncultured Caudovirales phage]|uniref:Holin of 3TMs, for gene-transfer release n=1 Tax=uncultured Caudovirales phage TaxID=2100421 RepID=A0A6J5L0Q8_9CAUD|nr:hypothetical protein UFOVP78_52 [uncultured Caudovirales phage]